MKPHEVLKEAMELQKKKSKDYNNGPVKHIDYYPYGMMSISQMIIGKTLRLRSLVDTGNTPEYESVRDTLIDLINYASFGVSFIDGDLDGQDE